MTSPSGSSSKLCATVAPGPWDSRASARRAAGSMAGEDARRIVRVPLSHVAKVSLTLRQSAALCTALSGMVKLLGMSMSPGNRRHLPDGWPPPRRFGRPFAPRHCHPTRDAVPPRVAVCRRGPQLPSRSAVVAKGTRRRQPARDLSCCLAPLQALGVGAAGPAHNGWAEHASAGGPPPAGAPA